MSTQDNTTPEADASYDPHRFSAETKRTRKKMVLPILIAFIVVLTAIGGSVMFAKSRISTYMAEREAKSKAEKEKQQEDKSRKEKEFASTAPLPAKFSTPMSTSVPPEPITDLPVIPLPTGSPKKQASPPKMMVDTGSDAILDKGLAKLPDPPPPQTPAAPPFSNVASKSSVKTVQDLAIQAREKAPVTTTPQASAANLGNRSFLLARGAFIPCVLETQLVSSIPGHSRCVVPQDVYSDDGKVLLVDKGSNIFGTYQSDFKLGSERIAILWQRIKTPTGVVLDVESPAADIVGAIGAVGVVDNHWMERIGAAFLLSIVEDAVKMATTRKEEPQTVTLTDVPGGVQAVSSGATAPQQMPSALVNTTKSTSQELLKSTINTPPTIFKNRGDRVTVFVNRDLWFDSVYQLTKR